MTYVWSECWHPLQLPWISPATVVASLQTNCEWVVKSSMSIKRTICKGEHVLGGFKRPSFTSTEFFMILMIMHWIKHTEIRDFRLQMALSPLVHIKCLQLLAQTQDSSSGLYRLEGVGILLPGNETCSMESILFNDSQWWSAYELQMPKSEWTINWTYYWDDDIMADINTLRIIWLHGHLTYRRGLMSFMGIWTTCKVENLGSFSVSTIRYHY